MDKKSRLGGAKCLKIVGLIMCFMMMMGCVSSTTAPGNKPSESSGSGSAGGGKPESVTPVPESDKAVPPVVHAPDAAAKPFRFVVMGDSRGNSGGTNEATLRGLLEKVKTLTPLPEFLLFTGDQVVGGSDVGKQLSNWKNIVDDYFPITSIYPALGNHEHNEKIFTDSFPMLPKEQLKGYLKTVYSFDYENARFITLNSDRKDASKHYVIDEHQQAWLENELKTSGKQHVFVQFHVPAYPIGAHLGSSLDAAPEARDALWSILDRYKVTAVLVGHEHNYNRRQVDSSFDGSGFHFANTIYQLTIGGAGAPLYTGSKENKRVVVGPKASYHYMVIDVNGGKATFKAYDLQQNEIDSFTVER